MYTPLSSSSSTSSVDVPRDSFPIPENYEFLHVLGEGAYGIVIECVNKETKEHVAVKIDTQPDHCGLLKEEIIMNTLMQNSLDNFNIVKCKGKLFTDSRLSLVYEMLDISLMDLIIDLGVPVFKMESIRTVIQQTAVALNALKSVGIIHTDVKLDNIMMVDHKRKPFRVKLIDFGLSLFTSQAKAGHCCQAPGYRAPEIVLGLPFSEAIDVWSLGCVMAVMVFGFSLFPTRFEYDLLRFMIDLLGPPPQHLIEAGKKSHMFFKKTKCGSWELMTPMEYWGTDNAIDHRCYSFTSLNERNMHAFPAGAERRECFALLKAMLQWDEKERITPGDILNHPFITKSFLNSSSHLSTCCDEPEASTSQGHTKSSKSTLMTQAEDIKILHAGLIMVQPATPENQIPLGGSTVSNSFYEDPDPPPVRFGENWIHFGDSSDEDSCLCLPPTARSALNPDTSSIEDAELPTVVSDDCVDCQDGENSQDRMHSESNEDSRKKKKKKKNCFKRFFSWMKRTFCSCTSVDCVIE